MLTQSNMHWYVDVSWSNVTPHKLHHTNGHAHKHFYSSHIFTFHFMDGLCPYIKCMFMFIHYTLYRCTHTELRNTNPISFVCHYTQTEDRWQSANDSNDLSIRYTFSITSIHVNLDLLFSTSLLPFVCSRSVLIGYNVQ